MALAAGDRGQRGVQGGTAAGRRHPSDLQRADAPHDARTGQDGDHSRRQRARLLRTQVYHSCRNLLLRCDHALGRGTVRDPAAVWHSGNELVSFNEVNIR